MLATTVQRILSEHSAYWPYLQGEVKTLVNAALSSTPSNKFDMG